MGKNCLYKIVCLKSKLKTLHPKIFVISLLLLSNLCLVNSAYSQKVQRFTLNLSNITLEKLFNTIESKSNYIFYYKDKTPMQRTVTFKAENATIEHILDKVLPADYSYKINERQIAITYTATKPMPAVKETGSVTGIVRDADGSPMAGVTLIIKGTLVGTVSKPDGSYVINRVALGNQTIEATFVGYEMQTARISNLLKDETKTVNIKMVSGIEVNSVVVTALGIKREEKSLGYAMTKLANEEFTAAANSNWLTGLSGKVAGLNFDQSSAGPGGSIRVTLRGEGSLSHDKNDALFVVDGVPINNDMVANSNAGTGNTDGAIDYGNGAGDINPDDIESVSVLKGPSATALYGSRAANGAIIITTKSGRQTKGIGVTVSSSVTIEQAGFWPDFQNEYGGGYNAVQLDAENITPRRYSHWNVPDQGITRNISTYAYGDRYDGKSIYLYGSRNWETGEYTPVPYEQQDWYKGFFKTGVTYSNYVSIDGNNGKGGSVRVSVKDVRNDWIVPNTGQNNQNFFLSFKQVLNPNLTLGGRVTYYRKSSDNLPMSGYHNGSPLYTLMVTPSTISMANYRDEYNSGRITKIRNATPGYSDRDLIDGGADNPYFQVYEQLNTYQRDRVFGNIDLNISLIKNILSLTLRTGMDLNSEFRTQRKPFYSRGSLTGMYREQDISGFQMNNDFMLNYKGVFNDFTVTAAAGGNNMYTRSRGVHVTAAKLIEPDVYTLRNSDGALNSNPTRSYKSINSFFGFVSTSWKNMLFVEVTGRNDWSSTLAPGNNSYFYPSVNASVLVDEVFNFKSKAPWVNMLKVRASWANVGNDTYPYRLEQTYSNSIFLGGYKLSNMINNRDIKPENVESWEFGVDARLFKNRVGVDVTYYNTVTTDQIIEAPSDYAAGAEFRMINAGKVTNKGVEIALRVDPIKTRNWRWTINANWSRNKNRLVELAPDVEMWQLNRSNTAGNRVFVYAFPGTELGRIYGKGFKRAEKGAFYTDENGNKHSCAGEVIVNSATGNPEMGHELQDFGSIYPEWKAGLSQTIKYKNVSLAMTFTGSWGGNAYSISNWALSSMGKLKNTLAGRYDGLLHPGVNQNPDGTYSKNKTITTNIVSYYNTSIWNRDNAEANTFSTSFLKMKECRLNYALPRKLCEKSGFLQSAEIGFYATNLFCITKWPQYDPEVAAFGSGSLSRGVETGGYPMTRTYGINVKLSF